MMEFLFKGSLVSLVSVILMIIHVLVGVAFLTLMERKVLGYIQDRKGPNKLGFLGVFQPIGDAVKLFNKENIFLMKANSVVYYLSPIMMLVMSMVMWLILPVFTNLYTMEWGVLFMLCGLSLGSYPLLMAGWSSNSNYSMLGAMRSVAQVISYEVSMIVIILSVMLMVGSYSLSECLSGFMFLNMISMMPVALMFYLSMLAELNRTPFDFVEGESELVSGFNTEYFGGGFALIFMSEYMSILFMSTVFVMFFIGGECLFSLFSSFIIMMVSFSVIWIRGVLPRMRYDEMMFMCWKVFLPISLNYMLFVVVMKWVFMN